jgi:hypothetical protein
MDTTLSDQARDWLVKSRYFAGYSLPMTRRTVYDQIRVPVIKEIDLQMKLSFVNLILIFINEILYIKR